jgi:hypothetical protein
MTGPLLHEHALSPPTSRALQAALAPQERQVGTRLHAKRLIESCFKHT